MKPYVPTMLCSYLAGGPGSPTAPPPRSRAAARGPLHQAFQFQPLVPAGGRNQCSGGMCSLASAKGSSLLKSFTHVNQ